MKRWGPPSLPAWLPVTLLLFIVTLTFWKVRIIDAGTTNYLEWGTVDLFTEHYPMAWYGFKMLSSGRVPLWDPYQLCGLPFMAVPHTGLFYLGNLPYLFFDTDIAIEIALVSHLVFAGLGMWLLARSLHLTGAGGLAGALTFMWSGWMMHYVQQASLVSAMCWLPMTVYLIERTIRGSASASLGVVFAVASQVFNGATEDFVYNMQVGALYALFRLGQLGFRGLWCVLGRRAALLLGCVAAGILLSAPQLVPSMELAAQSVRSAGSVSPRAAATGSIPPAILLLGTLAAIGQVKVGLLPVLGLPLGLGSRRFQNVWLFSLTTVIFAALLIIGGRVYGLYHATLLGGLFRTPAKFLHVWSFAQGLMAAIALTQLHHWRLLPTRRLWPKAGWILCLTVLGAAVYWLARHGPSNNYLTASFGLLLVFGLSANPTLRAGVISALLLLHGTTVFLGIDDISVSYTRPIAFPRGLMDGYKVALEQLKRAVGHERVYLSSRFRFNVGLQPKQGMMKELRVVEDYEALSQQRYAEFFEHASRKPRDWFTFAGYYGLGEQSQWKLLDLTSTRYYVVDEAEEANRFLAAAASTPEGSKDFRLVLIVGQFVRVYERLPYLPRAYYVSTARVLDSPQRVLATLEDHGFDPQREVLLEDAPQLTATSVAPEDGSATVHFIADETERVVINVQAPKPGFLVLTDAFYPGWRAFADGRELPIYRANYLFRAVAVGTGQTQVTFEYRPSSFRLGLILGGATAVSIVMIGLLSIRQGWRL